MKLPTLIGLVILNSSRVSAGGITLQQTPGIFSWPTTAVIPQDSPRQTYPAPAPRQSLPETPAEVILGACDITDIVIDVVIKSEKTPHVVQRVERRSGKKIKLKKKYIEAHELNYLLAYPNLLELDISESEIARLTAVVKPTDENPRTYPPRVHDYRLVVIPESAKKNLLRLDVSQCNFEPYVFTRFFSLEALIQINISRNPRFRFWECLHRDKTLWPNLQILIAENCGVPTSCVPLLGNLTSLGYLDLSGTDLSTNTKELNLSHFQHLEGLRLHNCNLNPSSMAGLQYFKNLTVLDISGNSKLHKIFNKNTFILAGPLNTVLYLDISGIGLDTTGLLSFAHFQKVRILNISNNPLGGPISSDFSFLGLANSVEKLDVSSCNISTALLGKMFTFERLKEMKATDNQLGNKLGAEFRFDADAKPPTFLDLSSNDLTAENLYSIFNLGPQLERLRLDDNPNLTFMSRDFEFGPLAATLKALSLVDCDLRIEGLFALVNAFLNLEVLNLSKNPVLGLQLSGNPTGAYSGQYSYGLQSPIYLGHTRFSFKALRHKLKVLMFEESHLRARGFYILTQLESLEVLCLANNICLFEDFPENFVFPNAWKEHMVSLLINRCDSTPEQERSLMKQLPKVDFQRCPYSLRSLV